MEKLTVFLTVGIMAVCLSAPAKETPKKIVIIKADDIRRPADGWNRFFEFSRAKNVNVSAGIICDSLQGDQPDYFNWLQKLQATGMVEFWNHGWDHKRWVNDQNEKIREFAGTGYDHQKKHFDDAQKIMANVLGAPPVAFGAPYNATDSDTARVMKEDPDMSLFFCYKPADLGDKVSALMHLRGEYDGTGKPNFEIFKEKYMQKPDLTFTVLQFHPNLFDEDRLAEYGKIIDFLRAEGWTFMLPKDYLRLIDEHPSF